MKLNLNIKIDVYTFLIILFILIILILSFFTIYDIPIITIYQNCTCPRSYGGW